MHDKKLTPKTIHEVCEVPASTCRWWRTTAGLLPAHEGRTFSEAEGFAHFVVANLVERGIAPRAAVAIANETVPLTGRSSRGGGFLFIAPHGNDRPEIVEVTTPPMELTMAAADDPLALILDLRPLYCDFIGRVARGRR